MPDWKELTDEIRQEGSAHDRVRKKYIKLLSDLTGRNTICYYSGWLQKQLQPGMRGFSLEDGDKNGFMAAIKGLDKSKGLDLILHTPGGSIAATESIVDYLISVFQDDIRAIVPQLAMSAGTMIALSCNEIIMGKHSSLGPVDPQYGGIPAHGVVEEFETAFREVKKDPSSAELWKVIISKYPIGFIGECQKALTLSRKMVYEALIRGMLRDNPDKESIAERIVKDFADHEVTFSHDRHISATKALELGVNVTMLERDQDLQDAVLTVHHAFTHTLNDTSVIKIIENQHGVAMTFSI